MRITAVVTVRNEGAFLLEWIAHHLGIGITDVVALSNDCDDGTDAMLDRLAEIAPVHHVPNPGPHEGGIQFAGLKRADAHPAVRDADWLVALDIDEFVNIHTGDHTLAALLAALPEADAITLTWRVFGNCGVRDHTDAPVLETFTRAAPEVMAWPWRIFMFKTLYRNTGAYGKLGV
ncbi:MAG: glycosyltransferase family 2 protein, partial [Maritimibacter sp.]|nr:glycosyltransferase family 2 protein [Maritimibacter sp.]